MEKLYRISPLEKKSVEYFVDVFERMPDGSIRGFDVTEVWRWGYGFRTEDDPVWAFETDRVHCRPEVGWGCDLDDLISVYVNFSDGFTDEEKEEIEAILRYEKEDEDGRCGTGWLYDGDHNWEIEDDHVAIIGPVKIDLVDANGYGDSAILEENVEPYVPEEGSIESNWPFPIEDDDNVKIETPEEHLQGFADALNEVFADELNNTTKTPEEIMGLDKKDKKKK